MLSFSTGNPTDGSSSELIYQGTVVGNRIVGQVSGNTTGPAGSGIYSGSFSMYKQ